MGDNKVEEVKKFEKTVNSKGEFILVEKPLSPPNLDIKDLKIEVDTIGKKGSRGLLRKIPRWASGKNITPLRDSKTGKIIKCKLTYSMIIAMLLELCLLFAILAVGMFIGWIYVLPLLVATLNTLLIQTLRVV